MGVKYFHNKYANDSTEQWTVKALLFSPQSNASGSFSHMDILRLVPRGPFQLGQANKKCKYTQYSPVCCFPFADAPELIHMVGPGGIWTLAPVLVNAVFEVKGICCADDQSQVG